jgi:hypothetical protein
MGAEAPWLNFHFHLSEKGKGLFKDLSGEAIQDKVKICIKALLVPCCKTPETVD